MTKPEENAEGGRAQLWVVVSWAAAATVIAAPLVALWVIIMADKAGDGRLFSKASGLAHAAQAGGGQDRGSRDGRDRTGTKR